MRATMDGVHVVRAPIHAGAREEVARNVEHIEPARTRRQNRARGRDGKGRRREGALSTLRVAFEAAAVAAQGHGRGAVGVERDAGLERGAADEGRARRGARGEVEEGVGGGESSEY